MVTRRPLIVDGHCHAGLGDGLSAPADTEARLDRYLQRAERAGIAHTVVFPVFNRNYDAANERLATLIARHRGRLTGFAGVNPTAAGAAISRTIRRAVEELGFRGIKVHRLDGPLSRPVCEAARRYGVPVVVDIVRQPAIVEMAASQYPDVSFIVPHLGAFADDWMTHLAVIDQMCRYPNVFADTSGVRYFDALVEAARRAPLQLIFGVDGPQLHPGVELFKVKALGLPPRLEAAVLGGTISSLITGGGPATGGDGAATAVRLSRR